MCAANRLSRRHQVPNWKGTRFSSVGEPEWRNEESTYRRGCGETIETRIGHSRDTEKMDIKFQFHCLGNCTNTFCFTKLHHLITVEAISYWKHSMSFTNWKLKLVILTNKVMHPLTNKYAARTIMLFQITIHKHPIICSVFCHYWHWSTPMLQKYGIGWFKTDREASDLKKVVNRLV